MTRRVLIGLLAIGLLIAGFAQPASAAAGDWAEGADGAEYVALGDSAAAGPLILPIDPSSLGCLRSTANYPNITAQALGVAVLTDVTCSAATSAHLTGPQPLPFGGYAPPQFDALSERTRVVTLTIGGNDTGLIGLALSCVTVLPPPIGTHCVDRYTAGGTDQIGARIAAFGPKLGAALAELRHRAPNAMVFVVGYGRYLPPRGCFPLVPLLPRDADYIQAKISQLNRVLYEQATAHGAQYIDIEGPSTGHDVCQLPGVKWYEALIPTSIAAPLHPNRLGMRGTGLYVAGVVSAALGLDRAAVS